MEKWIHWEPIENLSGKYYLDFFSWPDEGLIIHVYESQKKQKIEIFFNHFVDAFRYTNESYYFKLFGDLSEEYGDDFYAKRIFFKVENSEYLKWLSEKSCGWSDQLSFKYFCILGGDEVIDIVAQYEPKVKIID